MKHVALYCRLSPRPDGSYEGVDLQEKWGRAYAAKAWPGEPIEVFTDRGLSAAKDDVVRPAYERMREWVRDGRIAHVWAVEQSRLERREAPWFQLAAEFDAAGIEELHTNRDGVVRVTDDIAGIKAVLNAGEIRKLRRRVNDRLAEVADAGRPSGGVTFGYERDIDETGGKTLTIVPDQADVLREAADRVLAGWSLTSAAADLTARGIAGANGRPITYGTLKRMLTNPTVAGHRVFKGQIHRRGVWTPILDEPTWLALRERLSGSRSVRTANGGDYAVPATQARTRRRYLLTGGLAVCGVCGGPLGAQRRTRAGGQPFALYFCRVGSCVGVDADALEQRVADLLLDALDRPEFLAAVSADEDADRRQELTRALHTLDTGQRADLARRWGAGRLTDAEWDAARDALDARERELRAELAELPVEVARVDIGDVREAWPAMTLGERRELVELFVGTVRVDRAPRRGLNRVDIEARVPLTNIVWRA
ncbi:recombinase family protein [Nocardioides ungokensis]|uniref:recombinase family protein n=1 Tax=Nocardioides ungokensis TaxID=1643322 RepID=UPI0015DEAC4F|nr:recombinase family protein [Nocardioides ungokensis]